MRDARAAAALATALVVLAAGCTRRQIIPGVVAGVGAAAIASGAIYRATLDSEEPFGSTSGEIATTTVLMFGGLGILVTGVVLSITMSHCESNSDCWASDVCEQRTHTCISRSAARSLEPPSPPAHGTEPQPGADAGVDADAPDGGPPQADRDGGEERPPYPG
jgi:hypothetical protein